MKKQEIRQKYNDAVKLMLSNGYTIFPDTMNGSQGEIAHIDFTNGSEIVRVLLEKSYSSRRREDGYWGTTIRLIIDRAAADTWVGSTWDGTIWNNRLEILSQIEWAEIGRNGNWYTDLDEAVRIHRLQQERYRNRDDRASYIDLPESFKSAALRWVRKQPRMKTASLGDIEQIRKVKTPNGKTHYEIKARGRCFRTDD